MGVLFLATVRSHGRHKAPVAERRSVVTVDEVLSQETPKGTLGVRSLALGARHLLLSLLWAVKLGIVRVGLGRI